jgi:hypothetical protein
MGGHTLTNKDLNYTFQIDNGSEFGNITYADYLSDGQHPLLGIKIVVSDDRASEYEQWTEDPQRSGTVKLTITPRGGQRQEFIIPYTTWVGGGFVEFKVTNNAGQVKLP